MELKKQSDENPIKRLERETLRNITLTVRDEAHRRARIWAANHDMSVSKAVSAILERLPQMARSAGVSKPQANAKSGS
jgi:hypothetical protein